MSGSPPDPFLASPRPESNRGYMNIFSGHVRSLTFLLRSSGLFLRNSLPTSAAQSTSVYSGFRISGSKTTSMPPTRLQTSNLRYSLALLHNLMLLSGPSQESLGGLFIRCNFTLVLPLHILTSRIPLVLSDALEDALNTTGFQVTPMRNGYLLVRPTSWSQSSTYYRLFHLPHCFLS